MSSFILTGLILCLATIPMVHSAHIQHEIRRHEVPCRGVNLGSWLVVERWMSWNSSIWKGVPEEVGNTGEFETMKFLGHQEGDKRFEEHRKTWITKDDIREIANTSVINTLRVPIGYWIMGYDPTGHPNGEWSVFAPGALKYLDLLVKHWAKEYNLAVMIDIHAAKGSQSGMDHSAPPGGKSYWFGYPENIENTVQLALFLANRYRYDDAFLGIALLNEPNGNPEYNNKLKYYYDRAYNLIRKTGNTCTLVTSPLLYQQNYPHLADFGRWPRYFNMWQDWHKYTCFGDFWTSKTEDEVISEGIPHINREITEWEGKANYLFIGEWSFATAQRFSDTKKFQNYAQKYLKALSKAHAGWTFWSWKVSGDEQESRHGWSLRNMLRQKDEHGQPLVRF